MNLFKIIRNWLTDYQTYTGALYSLFSFPLGVIYFAVLVAGFAAGGVLSLMIIGLPVLLMMLVGARVVARLEALTARVMVGADVPAFDESLRYTGDVWQQARSVFTDSRNWRSVLFLLLKFPLGIASFVLFVLTATFLILPFSTLFNYDNPEMNINFLGITIDTLPEALLMIPVEMILLILAISGLRLFNVIWRNLAESLLNADAVHEDTVQQKQKRKRVERLSDDRNALAADAMIRDQAQRRLDNRQGS